MLEKAALVEQAIINFFHKRGGTIVHDQQSGKIGVYPAIGLGFLSEELAASIIADAEAS